MIILTDFSGVARPCTANGAFLKEPIPNPEPVQPPDATPKNPWLPFLIGWHPTGLNIIMCGFSHQKMKFTKVLTFGMLLSSNTNLNMNKLAMYLGGRNAQDLYDTLDSIKAGAASWKTFKFHYTGPKPHTPPQWIEETYELNT